MFRQATSKLSLEVACRNMMKHTGASLVDVFRYASYNPCRAVGFCDRGEIAGSKLSLDVACRNMMKHTGASIVDVFRYASYNPSRAIGFLDRGEIAVGKRADLVIVDHWMKVDKVILQGKVQNL